MSDAEGRQAGGEPSGAGTLDAIFRPKSVAVIGAATRKGAIGREILHNLINYDFQGTLFPVNPHASSIHSIKAYPTIQDVPDAVDLAIIVVPGKAVVEVAEQCGQKGVGALVVISAGFRESGEEGAAREAALLDVCRRHGMRMVGPNCLGVFNAEESVSLNATFAPGMPAPGPVGFISQSGALGVAIWNEMQKLRVGFSQFASIGNKADISGNDLLAYWEDDPAVRLMALYIESFGNPRRFIPLARRISRKKPILMVKSGRTGAGARAASSHTGALSGRDEATDALLRQTGVIRAGTIDQMLALIGGFAKCPVPKGPRVGVLTNAGGPGIMAVDALIGYGLELAELSETTRKALADRLPPEASLANPIDMIAGATPQHFRECLPILLGDDGVDIAIVAFVPPIMVDPTEVVRAITETSRDGDKPVYLILMAEERYYEDIPRRMPDCPPIFRYPDMASYTAAEMHQYGAWVRRDPGRVPELEVDRDAARRIVAERGERGEYLAQDAAFSLLEAYRFPLAAWRRVRCAEEASRAAAELGYPVVLKAVGPRIVHKSDLGAVILDIQNQLEMEGAVGRMTRDLARAGHAAEDLEFLVQPMLDPGREVILGMNADPLVGPLLLFGLGGKYVEVIKDVTLRVHPVTDVEAADMIRSIRGYALLEGVRGDEPVAFPVVQDALLRLSALVGDFPEIAEIDINPFLLHPDPDRCRIVDARIRLG